MLYIRAQPICWKTAFSSLMINFYTNKKSICRKLFILLWHSYSSKLSLFQPRNEMFCSMNHVDSLQHNGIKMNLFSFNFIQGPPTVPNNTWKLWPLFTFQSVPHLRVWNMMSQLRFYYFNSLQLCRNLQETAGRESRLTDVVSATFPFPTFWPHLSFLENLSPNWSWVAPCSTEEIEQTKWVTGRAKEAERRVGLKVRQKAERQTEGENEDRLRRCVSSGIFHTIFHSYHQILGLRFSPGLTEWQSISHQLCLPQLLTKWRP